VIAGPSRAQRSIPSRADENYLKHIEGFRRLAMSLSSICISLGSFSLALLVYSKSNNVEIDYVWLWLLQIAGIVFLLCSALCIDWIVDSFSQEEWDAVAAVSPELRVIRGKGDNQFLERVALYSTGYLLYTVAVCLLICVLIFYFGHGTTYQLF
jgi:hypothetical protein